MDKIRIAVSYSSGRSEEFVSDEALIKLEMRPDGNETWLKAEMQLPLIDAFATWHSFLTPGLYRMPWREEYPCGAQKNYPFYAVLNREGKVRAALESTNIIDDSKIVFTINQERCTAQMSLLVTLAAETQPFFIMLDRRGNGLMETLEAWRECLALPKMNYPDAAYEPVFCTWYVTHGEVDQAFVERTCPIAKELGFSTLIVDDGWCYDEYKRVNPDTLPTWYESVGDWDISKVKFPDFKEHVKRMQALGINYMLWVAPHLLGNKSKMHQKYKEQAFSDYIEGFCKLDVNKADCAPLVEKLRTLASDNGLDGLKIDFLDTVAPNTEKPNSRRTDAFISSLANGLKKDNPNVLIEFRQSYATPAMLKYGTQFRAGDAPFDWRLNFGRLAEIRLNIGSLAPVHADPAYWAKGELPHNVSRHCMAMLAGVPMLSMELESLTDVEKRIISHYVGFYRQHRSLISHGKWSVLFNQTEIAAAIVENEQERMIILSDGYCLDEALGKCDKKTWVMNLSDKCLAAKNATNVLDGECLPAADGCIPLGGSALINR